MREPRDATWSKTFADCWWTWDRSSNSSVNKKQKGHFMIIRKLDEAKTVEWGNGLSRRFLLEADGMGYTVTDTIVRKGTKSRLEYKDHLEACYCIEGKGLVIEMDGTEHEIVPGTIYALDKHDMHDLVASDE